MKLLTLILFSFSLYFTACTNKKTQTQAEEKPDLTDYTKRTVKLINGLGTVTIYLPNEFDTSFSFKEQSDYHCGFEKIFRFSSKKYTIDNDSGYYPHVILDSIYQFTIKQTYYPNCGMEEKSDSAELKHWKDNFLDMYYKSPSYYYKEELLKINNRDFTVEEFRVRNGDKRSKDSSKFLCQLQGGTILKNEGVCFIFTCRKSDTTGFLNNMMKRLKTIEIDTSK